LSQEKWRNARERKKLPKKGVGERKKNAGEEGQGINGGFRRGCREKKKVALKEKENREGKEEGSSKKKKRGVPGGLAKAVGGKECPEKGQTPEK